MKKISELDLSSFNTNNVTNMNNMFSGYENLSELDLSSFNTNNDTDIDYMLKECNYLSGVFINKFNIIKIKEQINISKIKF